MAPDPNQISQQGADQGSKNGTHTGPVVVTRNLTKAYGSNPPALRDVSLEIAPGVTGLLGPNGAGKSTLLQCILGLLKGYQGSATVLGLDAKRQRRALRRRVGFMPELDAYLFGVTGIHAVRYLAQLTGLPRREALRRSHEILFHVGLGEAVYRKVDEYSTGMRQRFKLAQAIVHDPDLIFLDEPLAGLDPEGRKEVRELILDLSARRGKHVVWSSHLLPDVQRVADQVAILHRGQSRGTFRMDDLQLQEGRYLVEVEGDGRALTDLLEGLDDGSIRVEPAKIGGEASATAGPSDDLRTKLLVVGPTSFEAQHVLAIGHHAGVRIRSVEPQSETLEDVFDRLLLEPASATTNGEGAAIFAPTAEESA